MSAQLFVDERRLESAESARGRRTSGILFVLVIALVLALAGAWLLDPRTLPIRKVRISGEFDRLSPVLLRDTASHAVQGGFFNVNVEIVRSVLLREPWVAGVAVRRVWPDGLMVEVEEQRPVAMWGDRALLNGNGDLFVPEPASIPAGLARLTGPAGTESLVLEQYRLMAQALSGHNVRVNRVELNERRAWSFELADGPLVILGRTRLAERLARFAAAVPAYLGEDIMRIDRVDMRYTNGFAVRWRETGAAEEQQERNDNG